LIGGSIVLANCRYVTPFGVNSGSISVRNGKIIKISRSDTINYGAAEVMNCHGNIALPGAIDTHVHIYSPGWIEETFASGTRAAAAGGVTTIFDMPSDDPHPTNTVRSFLEKKKIAQREALVNFGLYGGEIRRVSDVAEIAGLSKAGAIGFKLILGGAGFVEDDSVLYSAFEEIEKADSVAVVHAENSALVNLFRKRLAKSRKDPLAFLDARPTIVEEEALSRSILFASAAGNRLHIAHLPSKRGLEMVVQAKKDGLPVTAETCPHYLLMSRRDYKRYRHLMIVTPPIREIADQRSLWRGIVKQNLDTLATDHCAYKRLVKDKGKTSIWKTPGGIPGLETLLPLMLTYGVAKSRLSLDSLVRLVAEQPAKIFGLYPRKGAIRVGADGDMTLIDLKCRYRFRADEMQSVGDFSPFDGWKMKGKPVLTMVNGKIVMENGEISGSEKTGIFVRR
jgi:allantoinase